MWELDCEEGWVLNWCFWTVVLEKTLENPLDYKESPLVNPKGNQSWIFTGRTETKAEIPILWPPDGGHRQIKIWWLPSLYPVCFLSFYYYIDFHFLLEITRFQIQFLNRYHFYSPFYKLTCALNDTWKVFHLDIVNTESLETIQSINKWLVDI